MRGVSRVSRAVVFALTLALTAQATYAVEREGPRRPHIIRRVITWLFGDGLSIPPG